MRGLGLSLGLGKAKGSAATPPSFSTYTGASNVGPTDLIAEYQRSGTCISISDTQVLVVQGEGPTPLDIVSRVITRTGDTIALGDPTVLIDDMASGLYGLARGDKLSATRYITVGKVSSESNAQKIFLLSETGALLDSANVTGVNSYGYHDITAHSATKAVCAYADANNSNNVYLVGIDVTGDTISFGTPVLLSATTSTQMALCALTSSVGHVVHKNLVFRYTLSGTTVTVGNSVKQDSSKGNNALDDTKEILRIDDTHSLVFTTWDADGRLPYALVVTDAATPTVGTAIQLDSGGKPQPLWPTHGDVLDADGTQFLFVWNRNEVADKTAQSVVVYVDESYGLTKSSVAQLSGAIQADHTVGCSFGTSGYAVAFWQDENDNQAMGTVLIKGDG